MTKDELQTKKMELAAAADEILQRVKSENRYDLRGDEQATFDAHHAEIEKIAGLLTRMAKQDALAEPEGRRSEPTKPGGTPRPAATQTRVNQFDASESLRAWLLPERARTDAMRSVAQRTGVNLASNEFTFSLSPKALRDTSASAIAEWRSHQDEYRAAMGTTSGAVGAYSVPDSAMQALEIAMLSFGGMRSVATVLRTDSGSALPFPTTNDSSNKGAILTENTQVSEVDPTFGQLVLDAYMYSSKSVLISLQLLQDSAVNVPEMIGRLLGERIGRIQNDHFTTGTGSGEPKGVVAAATDSTVTSSSATLFTYDDVLDLLHSVDPAYRVNGRFMLPDAELKQLKKIKVLQYSGDTTGAPLWQPGMAAGDPNTIMGYPYVINQSMASGTGAKCLLFGDFSKFLIRDVREITILKLSERYADYHQAAFLAFARADSDLLDAGTNPVKWADHA